MKKTYLCKLCDNNNYGWCNALKRNIDKNKKKCNKYNGSNKEEFFGRQGVKIRQVNQDELKDKNKKYQPITKSLEENNSKHEGYEKTALAKREMLFTFMKQIEAIDNNDLVEDKIEAVKKSIASIESMLTSIENMNKIDINKYEFQTDIDIFNYTKELANKWS